MHASISYISNSPQLLLWSYNITLISKKKHPLTSISTAQCSLLNGSPQLPPSGHLNPFCLCMIHFPGNGLGREACMCFFLSKYFLIASDLAVYQPEYTTLIGSAIQNTTASVGRKHRADKWTFLYQMFEWLYGFYLFLHNIVKLHLGQIML